MSTCTDKLREAHANLANATQALRDALGSDGCNELLADCLLDQIAACSQTQRHVNRLFDVTNRAELQTPNPKRKTK
jgi:hypothetical protein